MSDIDLLTGFEKLDKSKLTKELKVQVINNVGILTEFASATANAAADGACSELHAQDLSFTAAFLSDLAGELNGLIQT